VHLGEAQDGCAHRQRIGDGDAFDLRRGLGATREPRTETRVREELVDSPRPERNHPSGQRCLVDDRDRELADVPREHPRPLP